MTISVFDLFKVGIGPSSSHTVGPMRAASMFADSVAADGLLDRVARVRVELFGSLGATGHGHGSVKAVVLGLEGERPELVDPAAAQPRVDRVQAGQTSCSAGRHEIAFTIDDVVMHRRKTLPFHANGMTFQALAADGGQLSSRTYYSGRRRLRRRTRTGGQDRIVAGRRRRCPTRSPPAPSCSPLPATGLPISAS